MRIFTNKNIKALFIGMSLFLFCNTILSQVILWRFHGNCRLALFILSLFMGCGILLLSLCYFHKQHIIMETAVAEIDDYLIGDTDARIECDDEGEMYKLFHSVNTLVSVLNAHIENEFRTKEFLKDTISDISHQLKTPLAALNIYNGILQSETENLPDLKEFTILSEQELDRIEALVQNLLKITRLDAGAIILEKNFENVSDMMHDIEQHFAYRAKQEQKELILSGDDDIMLFCDREWMIEAVSNLVKNAFDHTDAGKHICVEWKQMPDMLQIVVEDNGCGIHSEDVYHIFKRFYRSRFSKDTQGIGLGLPLAKTIVELHGGNMKVDSVLGKGSAFIINLFGLKENITKLSV
ncbi:MAG: HAMP domain-containing histidine kinase [Lachnospiraceae bacterium]